LPAVGLARVPLSVDEGIRRPVIKLPVMRCRREEEEEEEEEERRGGTIRRAAGGEERGRG